MPSFIGLGFILVGGWFLFQAFQSRREAQQLRAARESADQSANNTQANTDTQAGADTQANTEFAAAQRRRNRELQKFASGCAPVVAMGMVLMALGVSAIALMMNLTTDGPNRLSIFDILSILFFAGAFAYSLLTRTYYSAITLSERTPKEHEGDS